MKANTRRCANCDTITETHFTKFCSPDCRLRFWSTPEGDCWKWTGFNRDGHCHLTVEHRHYSLEHYLAALKGLTKKEGESFRQLCGHTDCANPDHIGIMPRNIVLNAGPRASKITPAKAMAIYRDPQTTSEVAKAHGCSCKTVRNIKSGITHYQTTGHKNPNKKDQSS